MSSRPPVACQDCGFFYDDPAWIEAVIPHAIWNNQISPNGGSSGILCIQCIANRCVAAGLTDVPTMLTAGPLKTEHVEAVNAFAPLKAVAEAAERVIQLGMLVQTLPGEPDAADALEAALAHPAVVAALAPEHP